MHIFLGSSEEDAKINWVAWDKVIDPVSKDGLGVGSLRIMNLAMLAKWWWAFKKEKGGMWRNIVCSFHHSDSSWSAMPAKVSLAGPWKQIVRIAP